MRQHALGNMQQGVEFSLVLGRLRMQPIRTGQTWQSGFRSNTPQGLISETLGIDLRTDPRLNYDLTSPEGVLHFTVKNGRHMELEARPREGPVFHFRQELSGRVECVWTDAGETRTCTGASIWHVVLAEQQRTRRDLLPFLEQLRPGWKLTERMAAVEEKLIESVQAGYVPPVDKWRTWIDDLADDDFTHRNEAEQRLRDVGPELLGFLTSIDFSALDAEQRFRVRRMIVEFSDAATEASPDSEARALAGDPTIWLTLLAREDLDTRKLAHAALQRLVREEIDFDPAADAQTRSRQHAALVDKLDPLPK